MSASPGRVVSFTQRCRKYKRRFPKERSGRNRSALGLRQDL